MSSGYEHVADLAPMAWYMWPTPIFQKKKTIVFPYFMTSKGSEKTALGSHRGVL
jgi:hypothetical protein